MQQNLKQTDIFHVVLVIGYREGLRDFFATLDNGV